MTRKAPSSRYVSEPRPIVAGSDDHEERAKTAARLERQMAIGEALKHAFEDVAAEETPSRLKQLAEALDRKLARGDRD